MNFSRIAAGFSAACELIALSSSAQTVSSPGFHPSGKWTIRFEPTARGRVFYRGQEKAQVGDEFNPTPFLSPELLQSLSELQELELRYDEGTQTVQISDPSDSRSREVQLDRELFGVAKQPLSVEAAEIGPDCSQMNEVVEWVKFKDPSTLEFYYRYTFTYFLSAQDNPNACAVILGELGSMIQDGSAGNFWKALASSGALDMTRGALVHEAGIFFMYVGNRVV